MPVLEIPRGGLSSVPVPVTRPGRLILRFGGGGMVTGTRPARPCPCGKRSQASRID